MLVNGALGIFKLKKISSPTLLTDVSNHFLVNYVMISTMGCGLSGAMAFQKPVLSYPQFDLNKFQWKFCQKQTHFSIKYYHKYDVNYPVCSSLKASNILLGLALLRSNDRETVLSL